VLDARHLTHVLQAEQRAAALFLLRQLECVAPIDGDVIDNDRLSNRAAEQALSHRVPSVLAWDEDQTEVPALRRGAEIEALLSPDSP
jgi:hypothetical protein